MHSCDRHYFSFSQKFETYELVDKDDFHEMVGHDRELLLSMLRIDHVSSGLTVPSGVKYYERRSMVFRISFTKLVLGKVMVRIINWTTALIIYYI